MQASYLNKTFSSFKEKDLIISEDKAFIHVFTDTFFMFAEQQFLPIQYKIIVKIFRDKLCGRYCA